MLPVSPTATSNSDVLKAGLLERVLPGGRGQLLAMLLATANGLVVSFVLGPLLIASHDLSTTGDSVYRQMAANVLQGQGLVWHAGAATLRMAKEPAYALFLAGSYAIFGTAALWPIQLFQALLVTVTSGLVWVLAFHVSERRELATVAAITFSLHPLPVWYSTRIANDVPAALLVTVAALLLLRVPGSRSLVTSLALGAALGFAALTRTATIGLLPISVAAILALPHQDGHRLCLRVLWHPVCRRCLSAIVVLLTFCLVVSPWAIRNYRLAGRPVFSVTVQGWGTVLDSFELERLWRPTDNIWPRGTEARKFTLIDTFYREEQSLHPGDSPAQTELSVDRRLRQVAISEAAADPVRFVRRTVMNALFFFNSAWSSSNSTSLYGPLVRILSGSSQ